MTQSHGRVRRQWPCRFAFLLLACAALAVPEAALAKCDFENNTRPSVVAFSAPSEIVLPNNPVRGTVLWASGMTAPTGTTTVSCNKVTNGGIVVAGANVAAGETEFPTKVKGLSFRLSRDTAGNYLQAYPAMSLEKNKEVTFSLRTSLELVVSGPIDEDTLSGKLASWEYEGFGTVQSFTVTPVKFVRPACTVVVDPTIVTMPAITTTSLPSFGSTAGTTPFAIQLNCSAGRQLSISVHTDDAYWLGRGVINGKNGAGQAQFVGVQITRPDGSEIEFDTPIQVGPTVQGSFSVPFKASYYCTWCGLFGARPSPGAVNATATYTLTYQ